MSNQQQTFQQIISERKPLLRRIFNFFIGYNTLGVLATIGSLFTISPDPIILINAVLNALVVAVLFSAKRMLGKPEMALRLQIFFVLGIILSIFSSVTTHNLVFMMPSAFLLCIILFSMLGFFSYTLWFGYTGVVVFFIVGMLEVLGYLHNLHTPTVESNISVIITLTFLFGASIAMLKLYNDVLLRSIAETTRRQQDAENARAEAAQSLVQVQNQASEQQKLLDLITDLETPAVPVLPGVLVLPIVGHLDSHRIVRLNDSLLERVSAERASTVLLDLTGVSLIDTATANHLIQMVRSVRLLGTRCIMTGVRAEVAQTMVTLGIDWGTIPTSASLQNAIQSILAERARSNGTALRA